MWIGPLPEKSIPSRDAGDGGAGNTFTAWFWGVVVHLQLLIKRAPAPVTGPYRVATRDRIGRILPCRKWMELSDWHAVIEPLAARRLHKAMYAAVMVSSFIDEGDRDL